MEILTGLHRADAAIVGGGLTGLLLGASLVHEGMKVALLDAGSSSLGLARAAVTLPSFAPAEVCGLDSVRQYAAALQAQLHALLALPLPYVQRAPAYTFALNQQDLPALEKQHALLTRLHLPVHIAPDAGGCPFPVELSLLMPDQAIVDLPRWMAALTASIRRRGGRIYANSRVTGFDGPRVCTQGGCILAPLTILTTGMPLGFRGEGLLACRTLVHCSLTGGAPLHSIQRSVQGDLILCPTPMGLVATLDAGRCGTRRQQERLARTNDQLRRFLPDCHPNEIQYRRVTFSADGLPLIGALPDSRRLCAAGVDGVLGAMHAASVLTRHILGRALPEDALYSPRRKLPPEVIRREQRRNTLIRTANALRFGAPECAHCGCRMRYTAPLSLWECPLCGSACTMLGQPAAGPGMAAVAVSPRQRPVE